MEIFTILLNFYAFSEQKNQTSLKKDKWPWWPSIPECLHCNFLKKSASRTTSKSLTKVFHPQRLLQAWLQLWPAFCHHTEYWQQLLQLVLPGLHNYPIFRVTSRCHCIHIERNEYKNIMSIFPIGGLHCFGSFNGFFKGD